MLIDFCHHSVQSKIKADRVSFDGNEVQNLVSGNPDEKRRGFLSDHFIKPPVNITVQFPCNVSIYRIVIDPVIGQQKSCDLKIFTATEKMIDSWLYTNNIDRKVQTDGVVFNYVGSVTQVEPTVICFVNNQFKERNSWKIENIPDVRSYPCVAQLNTRKPGGLFNASHVTVCLNRSKGGKSVALKRLEIWGIPSVKVPYPVQNTLRDVFVAATRQKESCRRIVPQKVVSSPELSSTVENTSNEVLIDGVTVPDDFIDQITFEIMTIPVTLPCGKNIDQSTLERFVNTEASWGRLPSDPFTGVTFSQGSGPVTNSSLKARIDQFVLKHSQLLKIPQTLGYSDVHKSRKRQIVSSKLVSNQPVCDSMCKYSIPELPDNASSSSRNIKGRSTDRSGLGQQEVTSTDRSGLGQQEVNQSCVLKKIETSSNPDITFSRSHKTCKRKQAEENLLQSRSTHKLNQIEDSLCIDLTSDTENDKIVPKKKQKLHSTDHNSDLSQSLDSALLSTLGNLPSFTKKSSQQSSVETSDKIHLCSKCRSDLTKSDVIKYRTSCGHFICRPCLVQEASSFMCNLCYSQCQSSQTVRMF